ncbi:MAG: hypothetical protein R3F60_08840 [bacterium]
MRELPPLTPLSERIQRHARHMGVLRLLGVSGARPIEQIPPFPEPDLTAPVRLREEELIAFVATEPRPVERPPEVERWMSEATPQFFLRNTWRATRQETDIRNEFEHLPTMERPEPPARLIQEAFIRTGLEVQTVPDALRSYVAERSALMVEPWHARFGRPDPG